MPFCRKPGNAAVRDTGNSISITGDDGVEIVIETERSVLAQLLAECADQGVPLVASARIASGCNVAAVSSAAKIPATASA